MEEAFANMAALIAGELIIAGLLVQNNRMTSSLVEKLSKLNAHLSRVENFVLRHDE